MKRNFEPPAWTRLFYEQIDFRLPLAPKISPKRLQVFLKIQRKNATSFKILGRPNFPSPKGETIIPSIFRSISLPKPSKSVKKTSPKSLHLVTSPDVFSPESPSLSGMLYPMAKATANEVAATVAGTIKGLPANTTQGGGRMAKNDRQFVANVL